MLQCSCTYSLQKWSGLKAASLGNTTSNVCCTYTLRLDLWRSISAHT